MLSNNGVEPAIVKMARFRQSLAETALREYKEGKGILQSKFGCYSCRYIWSRSKRCLS